MRNIAVCLAIVHMSCVAYAHFQCPFGFVDKFFFLTFIDFSQAQNYGSLFSLFLMKSSSLDDVAMTDPCVALGSPQHYLRKWISRIEQWHKDLVVLWSWATHMMGDLLIWRLQKSLLQSKSDLESVRRRENSCQSLISLKDMKKIYKRTCIRENLRYKIIFFPLYFVPSFSE